MHRTFLALARHRVAHVAGLAGLSLLLGAAEGTCTININIGGTDELVAWLGTLA